MDIHGNPVSLIVERTDGRIEVDAGTDPYVPMIARARGALRSLGDLATRTVHSHHVVGLLAWAPAQRGARELNIKTTLVAPVRDPELAGVLAFAGLDTLRRTSPAVFAALMRRIQDAGWVGGSPHGVV